MFKVQKDKCNQCLFSGNRIVTQKRAANIVRDCLKGDTFFVCHKSSMEKGGHGDVCCRGFWDAHKHDFNLGRIALRLGAVEEVNQSPEIKGEVE